MRVTFLGLGRMGVLMARHVLDAGHELVVWNRTPGRATELVTAGAREASDPAAAADGADAVALMLFGRTACARCCPRCCAPACSSSTAPPSGRRRRASSGEGTLGVLAGAREQDWSDVEPLLHL
jgi:3-hydroxyisobutyrate dehydrogenase-like beta-hydroxyacid dehydrogenase